MKDFKRRGQNGSIILVFLLTLPFLILIATYYMHLALTSFQVARFDQLHTEAQLAADAGADYAVEQINQNASWSGTASDVQIQNTNNVRTTFSASVSGDNSSKTVAITGKTYWPAASATPNRTVRINVDLRPVNAGTYSVVTGEGGLSMNNNSKIVGGDVFVNGQINLTNSAQIGLSTKPVSVEVADQACPQPPDSTYPRVCNAGEGSQPITIANLAHIYATVKATNQTDGSRMSNTGLVAGSSVAPQSLPTYNRAAQEAAVSHTMDGDSASCTSNNGTVTWPANTKITGNVIISHTCKVTVQGDVWITGSLSMSNSAQLIVADALGSTMPHIMVDGAGGAVFNNTSQVVSNSSATGFEILTYYSTASCSPECSSVTGTDLYNSRNVTTISLQQLTSGPNTVFYSYWTQISVGNSGQLGAVIGQTVQLNNSGTISFGGGTQLGDTTWVVKGYRRQ